MSVITVRHLKKSFHDGDRELPVLKGIDLTIDEGERLGICGASGSGKSTLLHCMAGLESLSSGEVLWEGQALQTLSEQSRSMLRRRMGFIFQQFHLLSHLSALENVSVPLLIDGCALDDAKARALEALGQVGLAGQVQRRPSRLSGGEQQRVAIARAIVGRPRIVFADEPTGNLDLATGEEILRLLLQLCEVGHMSLVLVTHNLSLMQRMHKRVELQNGHLETL